MITVIEKKTGIEYKAEKIEGGYQLYTLSGEKYKKLKDSTFKRNFKFVTDESEEDFEDVPEETPEEPKKQVKNSSKNAKRSKTSDPVVHKELSPEEKEKMIDKIKKILNLAENNPSIEEGLSAALKAQKLMAEYNIHEDEVTLEEIKDEIVSVFSQQKHNSHLLSWRKTLAVIVARNFRCKTYVSGKDIVFRGYRQDAQIALDVYMSLYSIGEYLASKLYAKSMQETGSGKGVHSSFTTGFLKGIDEGLSAQCTALMIITPKEVEDEWVEFSSSFKTTKTSLKICDVEAYRQGYSEGKAAVKARALPKKGDKA